MSIDQAMWNFTKENPPSDDELIAIADSLARQFADALGCKIESHRQHVVTGRAVVSDIHPIVSAVSFVDLTWEAIILYDVRSGEPPAVDIELFLFCLGKRLRPPNGDLINVRVERSPAGTATFRAFWIRDGDREWEDVTAPGPFADFIRTFDPPRSEASDL